MGDLMKLSEKQTVDEEVEQDLLSAGTTIIQVEQELRTVGLFGDVEEEKMAEIIGGFLLLRESGLTIDSEAPNNSPIEFIISTSGGSAHDMFAIYDAMRIVRQKCPVHTVALGKVMSAGVLLLAGGTKGHRKIGKNCRVMVHGVTGGHIGSIHNLENEMDEVRWLQDRYITALVEETDMTKSFLKKLIERKVNVYLTAEEAVEYGMADEVI
jgi:ATP-dependent Clp endopeptidase proteolytic subunit ClpP|tara:strand:+ start:3015 stop:3647 length:633 start_codon:yes stop_codon:yes gene_type:complete